jgi:transcriptional regulator with XRE-family HTH domain
MSQEPLTPHKAIAARIKELRRSRGWSAAHLAKEMAAVGVPWDRSIVANLELGRRASVSVQELFALAYVLGVAPVHLVVPPADDEQEYRIVPNELPVSVVDTRAWIRGQRPLGDRRTYFSEMPASEFYPEAFRRLEGRPDLQMAYLQAKEAGESPSALPMPFDRARNGER